MTLQVPFGDAFHQNLQWACQSEGRSNCRLRVTGEVRFTKGCFVKGIIQKASGEVCPKHMPFTSGFDIRVNFKCELQELLHLFLGHQEVAFARAYSGLTVCSARSTCLC